MKQISITELKPGDIFAKEVKLHGREAFEVIEIPEEKPYIIVKSRNEPNGYQKKMFTKNILWVVFLRRVDDII